MSVIQEIQNSNENYLIYPNPTAGTFSVLFGKKDSNVQLSVTNLNGQQVYTKQIGDISVEQEITVNLPCLSTGVYLVVISGSLKYKTFHLLKH